MHILFLLQSAFSIWMLVDAASKGLGCRWSFIILIPGGEIAYFFMVKIHDYPNLFKGKARKKSLSDLEYLASTAPSIENKLKFGQGLHDKGQFAKASEYFEEVLEAEESNKAALFGISQCFSQMNKVEDAVKNLKKLVELDFRYSNYEGSAELARLYSELGESEKAREIYEQISSKSKQLEHQVAYADFLLSNGEASSASSVLNTALLEYKNSPRYIQKRDKRAFKQAKSIQGRI